jgi:pimeloyl-ACP methyl ester carboxylesterase
MAESRTITMGDGRAVGFVDYGPADGTPILWCHGGPGSRLEPAQGAAAAAQHGLRLIGIDRPGYGLSTPWPGRSIADWVPDGLAVADALGIDRFVTVGVSTGGAYALALAAMAPDRVIATVACCALTDMRWAEGKAMMPGPPTEGVWNAPDRDTAMQIVIDTFGEDGSLMFSPDSGAPPLPPADLALFADPAWLMAMMEGASAMFAFGAQGYTDDRIADGVGWGSFDVSAIRCAVEVLHGAEDTIVPVAHAHHTASIVPGATLHIVDHLAHLSIVSELPAAVDRVTTVGKR